MKILNLFIKNNQQKIKINSKVPDLLEVKYNISAPVIKNKLEIYFYLDY